ncbi:MAG: DNA internalization-related competence protein ComEC/Rec2 [Acidobacteriota bacterium]|nr:DNA internalization-related competence protein ComEC/Rec2 [Acidobacteriota bacterium]
MRNDVPAALPLFSLIAGLALAPVLVNPRFTFASLAIVTLLFCVQRNTAAARNTFFVLLGLTLAMRVAHREADEQATFANFEADRFVTIEVPLERDWAARDNTFVLRASHFVANGQPFDAPVAVYARFKPPPMTTEATLRAEGFLRLNEQHEFTIGIKSPALMSYRGALRWWQPRAWNRALANRLGAQVDKWPEEVALAQALLLGRGELLTEEMRDGFRRGGTYHLLVFSGLQIAFAAGILALFLRWLHKPRAADWLLLLFAGIAPLFIGPTASVSRASTGIALFALARILKRPTSLENLWCVAALLRLIVEPRDLTDSSFHLTYAGAGALLFIGRTIASRRWLAHALAAEAAIAPLTLFHFHQYALGGTILTFLMAPLIFAMLVAATLACAFPRALALIRLLHRVCIFLNAFGYSGFFASPPLHVLITSALAALLALAMLRGRTRAIALTCVLLIPSLAAIVRSVSQHDVPHPRVTFLDAGQGDAIAVRSGTHTLLIDGGRDARVLPLLADRGIRHIDAVVLTHAHPDHCAALPEVIEQFGVDRVFIHARRFRGDCATRILAACSRSSTPVHVLRDAETFHIGAFTFVAHLAHQNFRRARENNASVVLRATAGSRHFLFTGDIEKEAELSLGDRDLRADVLKVAHHGSRTSTSASFLEQVAPRIAVISCGRNNLFGHPHTAVVDALRDHHIRAWRTDRDGSIDVDVTGGRLYVTTGND